MVRIQHHVSARIVSPLAGRRHGGAHRAERAGRKRARLITAASLPARRAASLRRAGMAGDAAAVGGGAEEFRLSAVLALNVISRVPALQLSIAALRQCPLWARCKQKRLEVRCRQRSCPHTAFSQESPCGNGRGESLMLEMVHHTPGRWQRRARCGFYQCPPSRCSLPPPERLSAPSRERRPRKAAPGPVGDNLVTFQRCQCQLRVRRMNWVDPLPVQGEEDR